MRVVTFSESRNSLMETEHLLKTPANATHLARSLAEYRQGKASPHDLDDDDLVIIAVAIMTTDPPRIA